MTYRVNGSVDVINAVGVVSLLSFWVGEQIACCTK